MCKLFDAYGICLFWSTYVNYSQQFNEVPKSRDRTSKVICCPSSFPEASPLQWQIHSSSRGPQFWEAYKGSQGSKCLMPFSYYQFHIKIKIGFFLGSIPRNQSPITDNYCYLDMSLHQTNNFVEANSYSSRNAFFVENLPLRLRDFTITAQRQSF